MEWTLIKVIGTGEDDPDTSKSDIMTQGKRWLEAAEATVLCDKGEIGVEVSPLISYVSHSLSKKYNCSQKDVLMDLCLGRVAKDCNFSRVEQLKLRL